jgi:hypothetical protein
MFAVMCDESQPKKRRDEMAKTAAPYVFGELVSRLAVFKVQLDEISKR